MTDRTTDPPRIAVLGASNWAVTYHLPALKALEANGEVRVAGLWNRTASKAVEAARVLGIRHVYQTLEEVLRDDGVDCYSILVSPDAIPGIVERLLPRGLPIFMEKTPGKTYAAAAELAPKVDVPNVVAFNRRYMPLNQRYKELVDAHDHIHFVECHFYRHDRTYPNFVTHTGIHGINAMEYFFGPVIAVKTERGPNPENQTSLWLCRVDFASGLRGMMKFLPCSGSSVERYEAHSNEVSLHLFSPQTYTSDYPGKIIIHRKGRVDETIDGREDDGVIVNAGFVNEYRDFLGCVGSAEASASPIESACRSMELAERIEAGEDYP